MKLILLFLISGKSVIDLKLETFGEVCRVAIANYNFAAVYSSLKSKITKKKKKIYIYCDNLSKNINNRVCLMLLLTRALINDYLIA